MNATLQKTILIAALWSVACTSAMAQAARFREELAVDRAGNSFVSMSLSPTGTVYAAVVNASGQLAHCRALSALERAQPRRDAEGFLVLSRPATTGSFQLERWNALGQVDWRHATPGFHFAATADGGAALWEESNIGPVGGNFWTQLLRLDAAGALRWRTLLYSNYGTTGAVDLHEDRYGRIHFAARARLFFGFPGNPAGTARLGMVNADGSPGWLHQEARAQGAASQLLDNGTGDLWWHLGADILRPSQVQRWTPWGMPLMIYYGPALVPGTEIIEPALDSRDALWYLAYSPTRDHELVRVGTAGLEARNLLDVRTSYRLGSDGRFHQFSTRLSVAAGSAWVAGSRNGVIDELTVERYTGDGLVMQRRLPGQARVLGLVATPADDARLLMEDPTGQGWLARLTPRRGEESWRVSGQALYEACLAQP